MRRHQRPGDRCAIARDQHDRIGHRCPRGLIGNLEDDHVPALLAVGCHLAIYQELPSESPYFVLISSRMLGPMHCVSVELTHRFQSPRRTPRWAKFRAALTARQGTPVGTDVLYAGRHMIWFL